MSWESNRIKSFAVIVLVFFITAFTTDSNAQDDSHHDLVSRGLAHLTVRAQLKENGKVVEKQATGMVVSRDGLVLTVWHLIKDLGEVVPRTVNIEARLGSKVAPPIPAALIDASITTDLLLLKLLPSSADYATIRFGSPTEHQDTSQLFSQGFPSSLPEKRLLSSKIRTRFGPLPSGFYLWGTGFTFEDGESGSPVYNDRGEVLGIAKGVEGSTGYFIPVMYAESLLSQIRLKEIRDEMRGFSHLRTQLNWRLEYDQGKDVLNVIYEKTIPGEPHVAYINLVLVIDGYDFDQERIKLSPSWQINRLEKPSLRSDSSGVFEVKDFKHQVRSKGEGFANIRDIEIDVIPFIQATDIGSKAVASATRLRKARLELEYED
ncbi:MAG: serine protease [Pseudomonadota bacterium]